MSEHLLISVSQLKGQSLLVQAIFGHKIEGSPVPHEEAGRFHDSAGYLLTLCSASQGHPSLSWVCDDLRDTPQYRPTLFYFPLQFVLFEMIFK